MQFRFSTLVLPLLLGSCATTYVPATGSDAATLSIANRTNGIAYATAFKNARDCSGGKQVIAPLGIAPGGAQSITVPASTDFSFFVTTPDSYVGTGAGIAAVSCFVPVTFTPRPGAIYRASFLLNETKSACQVHIYIVKDEMEEPDSTARLRTWRTPFSESGSFCESDS
jgi:hypothetical protein